MTYDTVPPSADARATALAVAHQIIQFQAFNLSVDEKGNKLDDYAAVRARAQLTAEIAKTLLAAVEARPSSTGTRSR